MKKKLYKVVYFDEGSAADFLQIHHGGKVEVVDEEGTESKLQMKGKAGAQVTAGMGWFTSLLKVSGTISGEALSERAKDSLVKTTISNTLLADFVEVADEQSDAGSNLLSIFHSWKVSPIEDSFTFVKMFAPYIKLLKEDTELTRELGDINFTETDEILKGAKGYYELQAVKDDQKVILRFNIHAFRNGYTLNDLTRMDLTFYGMEVGSSNEEDFFFENEFPQSKKNSLIKTDKPTTEEIFFEEDESKQKDEMDSEEMGIEESEPSSPIDKPILIYDVFLAGISREVKE